MASEVTPSGRRFFTILQQQQQRSPEGLARGPLRAGSFGGNRRGEREGNSDDFSIGDDDGGFLV